MPSYVFSYLIQLTSNLICTEKWLAVGMKFMFSYLLRCVHEPVLCMGDGMGVPAPARNGDDRRDDSTTVHTTHVSSRE